MTIECNGIYEVVSGQVRFRVLEADPVADEAIIIQMGVRLARPRVRDLGGLRDQLETGAIIPVLMEATPVAGTPKHITDHRDSMMKVIQPLLDIGLRELATGRFWRQIEKAATSNDLSPNCIFGNLTRYFQGGCCPAALQPKWRNCGRAKCDAGADQVDYRITKQPNSFSLTPCAIGWVKADADQFYNGVNHWDDAHREHLRKRYRSCVEIDRDGREVVRTLPAAKCPSRWQFYRIGRRHLKTIGRIIAKLGKRGFELGGRGKPGSQAAAGLYPGYVSEIDWTLTDVVAVRRGNRTSIGRLIVYAIADRYSGIIQSIYLTIANGSWDEAARAILICMEDKVEVCARANLTIKPEDWAVAHSFHTLVSDKGEVDSWKSTPLATGLGITIQHAVGRRPDQKGTIEAVMKVINYLLYRRLLGVTTGVRKRCEDDARVTASYDFDQLNTLLHAFVILWNKRLRGRQPRTIGIHNDKVLSVPKHIWQWGVENGCVRCGDLAKARLQLLPWWEASVTEHGFMLKGLRYIVPDVNPASSDGIDASEMLATARQRRSKVPLAVDPRTVAYVWLRHAPRGKAATMTKCPLAAGQSGYEHLSWEEWRLRRAEEKIGVKEYKDGPLRAAHEEFAAVARQIAADAQSLTRGARIGLSKADQIRGIQENRRLEAAGRVAPTRPAGPTPPVHVLRPYFDPEVWGDDSTDELGKTA